MANWWKQSSWDGGAQRDAWADAGAGSSANATAGGAAQDGRSGWAGNRWDGMGGNHSSAAAADYGTGEADGNSKWQNSKWGQQAAANNSAWQKDGVLRNRLQEFKVLVDQLQPTLDNLTGSRRSMEGVYWKEFEQQRKALVEHYENTFVDFATVTAALTEKVAKVEHYISLLCPEEEEKHEQETKENDKVQEEHKEKDQAQEETAVNVQAQVLVTKLLPLRAAQQNHRASGFANSRMGVHVQVYSVLTGGIVCETTIHRDASVADLKQKLVASTKIPKGLQQLLFNDGNTLDDTQPCGFYAGDVLAVQLARLPLRRDCCTLDELRDALTALIRLGPEAVGAYAGDVVSVLQGPLEEVQNCHYGYAFAVNARVQLAAIDALQTLGSSVSDYAYDVAVAWPTLIDEETAKYTIDNCGYSYFPDIAHSSWSDSLWGKICSLWSSMNTHGIAILMDNFHDLFSHLGPGQRGLALLAVTHAAFALPEAEELLRLDWFTEFLKERHVYVHICAVKCMCEIIDKMRLKPDLHAQYGDVLRLLMRPNRELSGDYWGDYWRRPPRDVLRGLVCQLLGRCAPLPVPGRRRLVAAMLSSVSEEDAQRELDRFKRTVSWKSHGAYMWFLKKKCTVGSLSFACRGGCDTLSLIIEEYPKLLSDAGPGQQAIVLLCAARSLPACTKSAAVVYATWFADLLSDPRWELRACAIHCLQRVMAGSMVNQADKIALLLEDPDSFVRSSAATALGCFGGGAVRYKTQLLSLLTGTSATARYASLVTLGSLSFKLRPHRGLIAEYLNDPDLKCRMAALRALKCMGQSAAPYEHILLKWQSRWYGSKPETITTRALMFKNAPLKDLFKGHAPLGRQFGGCAATRSRRHAELSAYMREARGPDCDDEPGPGTDMPFAPADFKEARERYRSVQQRHQTIAAARRQHAQQERSLFKRQRLHRIDQGLPRAARGSTRSSHGMREHAWNARAAADWVIMPPSTSIESLPRLDWP